MAEPTARLIRCLCAALLLTSAACSDRDAANSDDNGTATTPLPAAGDTGAAAAYAGDSALTTAGGTDSAGAVGLSGGTGAGSNSPGARSGGNAGGTLAPSGSAAGQPNTATPAQPAEGGDEGARILTRMAAKYESIRTLTADFAMRTENPLLRTSSNSRGKLYQQRPDRIALRFTQPAGDVILSDGTNFWLYMPSVYENQVIKTPAAAAGSRLVDLQAQFVGDPVKRFRYTMNGVEQVGGRATSVLTLIPRTAAPYKSLKVWVDSEDAMVRRFEFVEPSGVVRRMDLSDTRINAAVPVSTFRFTVPDGVRVVAQ